MKFTVDWLRDHDEHVGADDHNGRIGVDDYDSGCFRCWYHPDDRNDGSGHASRRQCRQHLVPVRSGQSGRFHLL